MIFLFGLSANTASGGFASLRTPTLALITASWFSVFIISHQESRFNDVSRPDHRNLQLGLSISVALYQFGCHQNLR